MDCPSTDEAVVQFAELLANAAGAKLGRLLHINGSLEPVDGASHDFGYSYSRYAAVVPPAREQWTSLELADITYIVIVEVWYVIGK